jgi:hypothetical protein
VEQVLLPVLAARPVEQAVLLHGAGRHWEAGVFSDLPRGIPVPIPPGERCELFIKSKAEIEKAESRNGIPLRRLVNCLRFHNFCFLLFPKAAGHLPRFNLIRNRFPVNPLKKTLIPKT